MKEPGGSSVGRATGKHNQEAERSNRSPRTFFLHEKLGKLECPYLERWALLFYLFSLRLHHWLASDDQRFFHDHGWWYISIVLKGHYIERSPSGCVWRRAGSIAFYPAIHRHSVIVNKPCWTLLITGREKRVWGFWVDGRFRKRNKYFFMYGHHPCN